MSDRRFADLHQHVLWGIDDGPRNAEQMKAQLKAAHENGIGLIAATSHAYPDHRPFDLDGYLARLEEANAICQQEGWPLQVVQGCEIHYGSRVPDLLDAGKLPTLGGSRYVLVEFSDDVTLTKLSDAVNRLYQAGYWPVIAHVERYRCLVQSPKKAMDVHDELGVMFQMNCETILSPRGFFERRFMRRMLAEGAIDLIATDAHNMTARPIKLRETYAFLEQSDDALAAQLLENSWQIVGQKYKEML